MSTETPTKYYRTRIAHIHSHGSGTDKTFEADFDQTKFYEILGRYTVKYDPPVDMMGSGNVREYDFYKRKGNETYTVNFRFWEIEKKDMKPMHTTSYKPSDKKVDYVTYVPPVIEPNPPQIEALLELKVLS